jgi:hypothetical protein
MDAIARIAAVDAARVAGSIAWEKTAVKGQSYEEVVAGAVVRQAAVWEDIAERVGHQRGTTGRMTGDILVEVAGAGRYVVEAKDRRLPLKRALDELRAAVDTHEAHAGLLVFSSDENCPARRRSPPTTTSAWSTCRKTTPILSP